MLIVVYLTKFFPLIVMVNPCRGQPVTVTLMDELHAGASREVTIGTE
jgi:hypothetical protein